MERLAVKELELERFLPYRLSVLSNTISQAIAHDYQSRFQLTVTEWRVIAILARFDGISAREVAQKTAMDKVAVSRAVARLVRSNRVRRGIAADDKRRNVLSLSATGRKIHAAVAPLALRRERRLLAHLSAAERRALNRILDKMAVAKLAD